MEDGVLPPDGTQWTLLDDLVDLDLMDELLSEEVWLETPQGLGLLRQQDASASPARFGSSYPSPLFEIENMVLNPNPEECPNSEDVEGSSSSKIRPQVEEGTEEMIGTQLSPCTSDYAQCSGRPSETDEAAPRGWGIQPRAYPGLVTSFKERLARTLSHIKESYRDCDVLIQMWVPVNNGERQVLTTSGQPFSLNPNCQRLMNYRTVSTCYQFSVEENSTEAHGLPGRVFLWKLPEWSPDVRYLSNYEYPRVNYAQRYDVRGTLAIPIFQRHSRVCLGVVEVVMTTERISYCSDLQHICSALKAADLNSSEVLSVPHVKMKNDSYLDVLPEISVVLRAVCQAHRLPLAQTWIPCMEQGKSGSRHTDENYKDCVSTVDASCYVNDPFLSDFHKACSEHHVLRGQGVVGKAFTTNQPCFSSDITALSKSEYPLAQHARMFGLRAAVAIRLRSIHSGKADYVLEFFLPTDCIMSEEQKEMLNSLSVTLQKVCQSLRVLTANELEEEAVLQLNIQSVSRVAYRKRSDGDNRNQDRSKVLMSPSVGESVLEQSGITSIMESQRKDKNGILCASPAFEEHELQRIRVTSQWGSSEVELPEGKSLSDSKPSYHQAAAKNITECGDSFSDQPCFRTGGKVIERKRTKTEKAISLQLLQQHFAGSLKDAAKSLGVCPTTLKRICRQHGITRWPSRKIKKVGHSLKKLQVVMNSVPGVDVSFQLRSLYANFPSSSSTDVIVNTQKATKSMICPPKQDDDPESSTAHHGLVTSHASASNSLSSSSSQTSGSSHCSSCGAKHCTRVARGPVKEELSIQENQSGVLTRASSELKLPLLSHEIHETLTRSLSLKSLGENSGPVSLSPPCQNRHVNGQLRVKAMYGEEKNRFSLHPTWGIQELKYEIAKRFHISDMNSVDLKYLDDDSEWVLLTCDADLQECTDIHRSSCIQTIKISVHHSAEPSTISFGSGL
uniref:Protein NLP1 n=2 Tax=Anthurium amnicola TaxID=1678845 RepID=A0A1D1XT89_9ARAE